MCMRGTGLHVFLLTGTGCIALQSLLQAVGVGAKNSLPAAAGINWVLKDGLGRLGRLSVSTRFGTSFDSNLKVNIALNLQRPSPPPQRQLPDSSFASCCAGTIRPSIACMTADKVHFCSVMGCNHTDYT